jgi:hypothetical protein|tara:strand:+ start:1474 stop:1929 length:456 start_codon:yes stop_codon:yes gene_type:complete
MFGGNQPKSKFDIIKRFAKERMDKIKSQDSSFAFQGAISGMDDIDSWDTMMLEGLPESNIVTMVESYIAMKNQGLDDYTIFQNIEDHRSSFDPYPNPKPVPSNPNLKNYIYFRLEFELPNDAGFNIGENGFTRDFIERVVDDSVKHYSSSY